MDKHDVVDYLANASDEEFAEIFVRYNWLVYKFGTTREGRIAETSEELDLTSAMMRIDTKGLTEHINKSLDEIIYSDEIDAGAWWKQEVC